MLFGPIGIGTRFDDEEEDSRPHSAKLFGAIAAAFSVVLFVLTENMHLAMRLVDRWTALMFVLLIINAVFFFAEKDKREEAVA